MGPVRVSEAVYEGITKTWSQDKKKIGNIRYNIKGMIEATKKTYPLASAWINSNDYLYGIAAFSGVEISSRATARLPSTAAPDEPDNHPNVPLLQLTAVDNEAHNHPNVDLLQRETSPTRDPVTTVQPDPIKIDSEPEERYVVEIEEADEPLPVSLIEPCSGAEEGILHDSNKDDNEYYTEDEEEGEDGFKYPF